MATEIKYWTIGCKNGVVSPIWDNKSFSDATQVTINDNYIILSGEKADRSFLATPLYSVQTFIGWRDVNSGSLLTNNTKLDIDTLAYTTGSDGNKYYNIQAEFADSVEAEKKFYTTNAVDFLINDLKDAKSITVASYHTKLNDLSTPSLTDTTAHTQTGQATVVASFLSSDKLAWYRIWSDGWKECGFYLSSTTWEQHTYVLPISFNNAYYTSALSFISSATSTGYRMTEYSIVARTKTSITLYYGDNNTTNAHPIKSVYCCGY